MPDHHGTGRASRSRRSIREPIERIAVSEYDPLDYSSLARSCLVQLELQPMYRLPLSIAFNGAGVYALYYAGSFEPYSEYTPPEGQAPVRPIYAGKAEPAGARKGAASGAATRGQELLSRLRQHAKSLESVENLKASEFRCRFLVVVPLWIRMVERFLIEQTRPPWNGPLEGFGIHDPGKNRNPDVSWWDAMHPGRPAQLKWKAMIQFTRSQQDAQNRLHEWLAKPEEAREIVMDDEADGRAP